MYIHSCSFIFKHSGKHCKYSYEKVITQSNQWALCMPSLHAHMQWLHVLHRTAQYIYVHSLLKGDTQLSMLLPCMLWVYCMSLFNSWSSSEEKYVPSMWCWPGRTWPLNHPECRDLQFFTELQLGRWMIQVTDVMGPNSWSLIPCKYTPSVLGTIVWPMTLILPKNGCFCYILCYCFYGLHAE